MDSRKKSNREIEQLLRDLRIFYVFFVFDLDGRKTGEVELERPRRNMRKLLQKDPNPAENYWVLHFHKLWQMHSVLRPDSPARENLLAFLQHPCWKVASSIFKRFSVAPYTLADLFHIAEARINRILNGFNPKVGDSLKSYATPAFRNAIIDELRRHKSISICSDAILLRDCRPASLKGVLWESNQLSLENIIRYVLALECYQEEHAPIRPTGSRRLADPDDATWKTIVTLYNERCTQLPSLTEVVSVEEIKQWLKTCAKALRSPKRLPIITSNERPGQEKDEREDNLHDPKQVSVIDFAIIQEIQPRLNQTLKRAHEQLNPEDSSLLEASYSPQNSPRSRSQRQIAEQRYGDPDKQYQISRDLTKVKRCLEGTMGRFKQKALNEKPTREDLKYFSQYVERWLINHYDPLDDLNHKE